MLCFPHQLRVAHVMQKVDALNGQMSRLYVLGHDSYVEIHERAVAFPDALGEFPFLQMVMVVVILVIVKQGAWNELSAQ